MKFADLFSRATARWIKYSEYDAVKGKTGDWYIAPVKGSVSSVYDPIENAGEMVVDALNVGLKCLSGAYENERIIVDLISRIGFACLSVRSFYTKPFTD